MLDTEGVVAIRIRACLAIAVATLLAACGSPAPSQPTPGTSVPVGPSSSATATVAPPSPSPVRPSPSPEGRTRYVATTGSDDAAGSAGHPLLSIQAAVDASGPGDAVVIHGGTYAPFTVGVSARREAPFIVRAADGETVVILGSPLLESGIRVTRASSWVTLAGLHVTGVSGYRSAGVLVESVSTGPITLRDLTVTGNDGYGINVYESNNVSVQTSDLSHNGTGVQVIRQGSGVVIRGNSIHENDRMIRNTAQPTNDDYGAEGVTFDGTLGPVLVTQNRIWGNRAASDDYVWDGGAFSIFGASRVTISENTIWDNENVLETGTSGAACAGNAFVRNVAWGAATRGRSWGVLLRCGRQMLMANNTFTDLDAFAVSLDDDDSAFGGSIAGARIENNIFAMAAADKVFGLPAKGTLPPDLVLDHDLVWNPGGLLATITGSPPARDLVGLQALTGYEQHGVSADPVFVDAAGHDYHLGATSPAIDRAVPIPGLTEPFTGAAPDMGRWEFVPGT